MTPTNDWITDHRHWSQVSKATPWKHCADWQPPTAAAPTPTKPALAAGQRWRRRDGEVVRIFRSGNGFRAGNWSYDLDGTAPFGALGTRPQYDLIELLTPAPATTPRKFASLTRTITDFGHIIDAIDEDGVAWWMTLAMDDSEPEWHQLIPLPAKESAQ